MTTQDENLGLDCMEIQKDENSDELGLTKEQILLKNIQNIAEEYQEIEALKNKFIIALIENSNILDFSEFIKYPNYDIKENLIKKKDSNFEY